MKFLLKTASILYTVNAFFIVIFFAWVLYKRNYYTVYNIKTILQYGLSSVAVVIIASLVFLYAKILYKQANNNNISGLMTCIAIVSTALLGKVMYYDNPYFLFFIVLPCWFVLCAFIIAKVNSFIEKSQNP